MNSKLFKVVQAGFLASWQDAGRQQASQHGVTEGGSMDCHAAYWANRLLKREASAPLIEITMGMFAIEFLYDCQIALTGADLGAQLNQKSVVNWQNLSVVKGDVLKFSSARSGLRAYLALNADIDLAKTFASVSCVLREVPSGLSSRALQVGDEILGQVNPSVANRSVPPNFIPDYQQALVLQLIAGYQFDRFSPGAIETLLSNEYQIQPASNRMAILLDGEAVQHNIESLASEGIAYGSIQVPPAGQPVILLNDRQTMGGYPKLGCISRLSGSSLAQRFAPSKVRFELCSREQATRSYREFRDYFLSA